MSHEQSTPTPAIPATSRASSSSSAWMMDPTPIGGVDYYDAGLAIARVYAAGLIGPFAAALRSGAVVIRLDSGRAVWLGGSMIGGALESTDPDDSFDHELPDGSVVERLMSQLITGDVLNHAADGAEAWIRADVFDRWLASVEGSVEDVVEVVVEDSVEDLRAKFDRLSRDRDTTEVARLRDAAIFDHIVARGWQPAQPCPHRLGWGDVEKRFRELAGDAGETDQDPGTRKWTFRIGDESTGSDKDSFIALIKKV